MAFFNAWVAQFGCPRELHSDRGSNFQSEIFRKLCELLGIQKTQTCPRNPKSDGLVERQNKTLEKMLGMMVSGHQFDWDSNIPFVLMAYRSSVHESTRETPYMMRSGQEIALPLDIITPPIPGEEALSVPEYVLNVQKNMREAHDHARECLQKAAVRQKRGYLTRFNGKTYAPGDLVWYWFPRFKKGKTPKFIAGWEGPMVVIKKLSEVVYVIQKSRRSKPLTVHHDHLKPCKTREEVDVSWVGEAINPVIAPAEAEGPSNITPPHRPTRQHQSPTRYGDWYTGS